MDDVLLALELLGVDEEASVSEELRPVGDGLCSVEVELALGLELASVELLVVFCVFWSVVLACVFWPLVLVVSAVEVELLLGDVLEKVESVELCWPLTLVLPVSVVATDEELDGEVWLCCIRV